MEGVVAGVIRVNKKIPEEYTTWDPMSIELRSRWCRVMLEHYPIIFSATVMGMVSVATHMNGWHQSGDWVQLAKEFDAVGFTPEEFEALNDAIKEDPRAYPEWESGTREVEKGSSYVSNALITLSAGQNERPTIRLWASDWVDYLARVRGGEKPKAVVDEMLAPHWGEPAEVICE
jgi:hypothetical protein